MNTQKSVFKKLSAIEKVEEKVELSEDKVELASVRDFKSKVDKLENEFTPLLKEQVRLANDIKQSISKLEVLKKQFNSLNSDADEIKRSFQDLGIDIDANTDLYISKLDTRDRALDILIKNAQKAAQFIK